MAAPEPPCDESAWADLPSDLLCDVFGRLPSVVDHVRLSAVCHHWRTTAKLVPPPRRQLPWLALDHGGTVLDVANNTSLRLRLPTNKGSPCYPAGDNVFFIHHSDGRCGLIDGFSGAETPLPELAGLLEAHMVNPRNKLLAAMKNKPAMVISKVVVAASSSPLVAVLASGSNRSRVLVSTCRPASKANSCVVTAETSTVVDIALCQGKLFALSYREDLVAVDLSNGCLDRPTRREAKCYTPWIKGEDADPVRLRSYDEENKVERYLVESNGRLLMVKRWLHSAYYPTVRWFAVFEAELSDGPRLGRWKAVHSLHGRALFVGSPCSKSILAGDYAGVRGDCIYFLLEGSRYGTDCRPLGNSGVFGMIDKMITPLVPEPVSLTATISWDDSRRLPAWFFPLQV